MQDLLGIATEEAAHCILCYFVLMTVFLVLDVWRLLRLYGNANVLAEVVFETDSWRVLELLGNAAILAMRLFDYVMSHFRFESGIVAAKSIVLFIGLAAIEVMCYAAQIIMTIVPQSFTKVKKF